MAGIVYQGLDYLGVFPVMDLFEVDNRRQMFDDIRAMEQAAVKVLNSRSGLPLFEQPE